MDAGFRSADLSEAQYALYLELLDMGYEMAIGVPAPEERQKALERLGRGWAGENRSRDEAWERIARAGR